MFSFQEMALSKNQRGINLTKKKLKEIKKRVQESKNSMIMKKVLHSGYWRYKNQHYSIDSQAFDTSEVLNTRQSSINKYPSRLEPIE